MAQMTKKDILEALQEYSDKTLNPKFMQIDQRFGRVDEKMSALEQRVDQSKGEMIHQFHIISEDVISQVKLVAEGVMNLDGKFTREMGALRKNDEEIMAMLKFSHAELDKRIDTLETEVRELKRRLDRIEQRSIT
jgi:uncharacterized protein YceH (UPF0502 family)